MDWIELSEERDREEGRLSTGGSSAPDTAAAPIAVIGMAGRFPGAENVAQFWENLKTGRSFITEIPPERWDWRSNYLPDRQEALKEAKSVSRWGAFLKGVEQFDPLFFNISPGEATDLDPQERLFLQVCWEAMEDGGYTPERLRNRVVGLFAGITRKEYELYGITPHFHPTTSFGSVANRVSHLLGLKGPSMPVDVMCASSLAAIHLACEQIRSGETDLAMAGGVNLYLHPDSYVKLSLAGVVAHEEFCRIYGEGSGFVPGEAVGAVLLKSLEDARRDGDSIHAVIRGTAWNHSGKTNSYMSPNPAQQEAAMRSAIRRSGLNPAEIDYLEASANGSKMGDAIEARAIQRVFGETSESSLRIGSLKPNIGHAEAASGMAQLMKVILQMKHRTLAPTLQDPESAAGAKAPGILQKSLEAWGSGGRESGSAPLRAGVANVGAGGMNVHLVVEEYREPSHRLDSLSTSPVLLPLSAKSEDRLREYAGLLRDHPGLSQIPLRDLAWSFQRGRQEMEVRLALVVSDHAELIRKLDRFLEGAKEGEGLHTGEIYDETNQTEASGERRAGQVLEFSGSAPITSPESLHRVAALWVRGGRVDWEGLTQDRDVRMVSGLPTYPFKRRRCWPSFLPSEVSNRPTLARTGESPAQEEELYENKAAEFYTRGVEISGEEFEEEYLTFCPFQTEIPGFSMSRYFPNPKGDDRTLDLVRSKQIEMRQALFFKEEFQRIRRVQDIGCGHGTDVIQIADGYPHLHTVGYTITAAQADLGNRRIRQKGLEGRAEIHHADSSRILFPGHFDLIFGIEVTFHIRDKEGLFKNISSSLLPGGRVLLMDYFTSLRGAIADPNIEVTIPTIRDWADLLSRHGLLMDELVDVSPGIANFLYDPQVEENVRGHSEVVQRTLISYANQAVSLRNGWINYCLFKMVKGDPLMNYEDRLEHNLRHFRQTVPYYDVLREMERRGAPPYPRTRIESLR